MPKQVPYWRNHPIIPNRLRVLRAEIRVNQYEVAAKLGCGQARYWRIENGYQEPTPAEIKNLCKQFGKTVQEIFPAARQVTAAAKPEWDLRAGVNEKAS